MSVGTFFQKLGVLGLILVLMASVVVLGLQSQEVIVHGYFLAVPVQTDHERSLTTDYRPLVSDLLKQVERCLAKLSPAPSPLVSEQAIAGYTHEFIPAIIILTFFRFFQNSRSVSRTDFSADLPADTIN